MTQAYFNFAISIINFILGLFVLSKNWRSITNRTFALFVWITSFWIFNVSLLQTSPSLFRGLLTIGSGFLLGFGFLLFVRFFPEAKKKPGIGFYIFLLFPIILFLLATPYKLVLKDVIIEEGKVPQPIFGPAFILLVFYASLAATHEMFLLYKKFRASFGIAKLQLKYLFLGFSLFIGATIINSVILPALGITRFSFLTPAFSLLFIVFTSFAITKYHLFEINIVLTELLVGLMGLVLAGEIFLFKTLQTKILGFGVFFLFCIFGYLLVRATHQEIKRKEELQKAYNELKKLDEAKSEFIAMASHQLRTPLTIIKGFVSMLIEGSYGKMPQKARKPLKNIFSSNERLVRIINDLLSISKIELGKLELSKQKAQIEDLIEDVLKELCPGAKKKGLYLKWEKTEKPLPELEIDSLKIRQVIFTVIDNAIKYTQKGGAIIKCQMADNKCQITISDTGAGMTKEETKRIFESFVRGSAGIDLWVQGTGLGLYLAKRYVELHQGRIWAKSPGKNKGSTFYIELPIK